METRLLVQTRSCRTGKDCPRTHVLEVDEGEVERRISESESVRKSTRKYLHPPRSFPQPHSTNTNTLQRLYATTCVQKQGLAWCARAGSGRVEGQKCNKVWMIVESSASEVDTSMWPARHWSHWQLPRFTIEDEDRRGERRGCGAVMRECGQMVVLLYASRDPH